MTHQFTVEGMTCGHCEAAVTRAIKQLDAAAQVSIDRKRACAWNPASRARRWPPPSAKKATKCWPENRPRPCPPPGRKRWSKRKNGRENGRKRADQQRFFAPLSIA